MVNVFLAFVTGLTTGGLSCLAVQGGLLASSLANQIEKDLQGSHQAAPGGRNKKKGANLSPAKRSPKVALPILAFLAAKLIAYTILGFILGALGSMFQLSPLTRAFLQVAIGIFMVGSALRMLNVHPIFRYFVFEPPAFLRRRIRKTASSSTSVAAPLFLGFLTVLIPCGVTQAMMAVALSTASPVEGAALMFAFTLGASPVFFAVAYFATQLGARLEKHFMRAVALVMLVLGIVAIDTGLTLGGSPVSLTRAFNRLIAPPVQAAQPAAPVDEDLQVFEPMPIEPVQAGPALPAEDENAASPGENVVTVNVMNYGYEPRVVQANAGEPVKLRLVTQDVYSCSRAFVIPALGVQELLEATGEVVVEIPPQAVGTRMAFSCSMGMFTGDIIFN